MTVSTWRAGLAERTVPRWVPVTSLLLSVLGVGLSGYLSVEHYRATPRLACPETAVVNCVKVTTSSYSAVAGIPVAVLGLAFFAALTLLCLPAAWSLSGSPGRALDRLRLGATLVGVGFVLYLIWVELFRVNAVCLWCTAVHLVTLALFAVVAVGTAALPPPR